MSQAGLRDALHVNDLRTLSSKGGAAGLALKDML